MKGNRIIAYSGLGVEFPDYSNKPLQNSALDEIIIKIGEHKDRIHYVPCFFTKLKIMYLSILLSSILRLYLEISITGIPPDHCTIKYGVCGFDTHKQTVRADGIDIPT